MAIDFNKFLPSSNTITPPKVSGGIDFNKFLQPTQPQETKRVYLPEPLGGGAYTSGQPNVIYKTPAKYGLVPTKLGEEGHHIIPVSFGGLSEEYNFKALGIEDHARITSVGNKALTDYNRGLITKNTAIVQVTGELQTILDEQKGINQSVRANLLAGVRYIFSKGGFDKIKETAPQTTQAVKTLLETKPIAEKTVIQDTVKDYVKSIYETDKEAIERVKTLFTTKTKTKSEKFGQFLKAVTGTVGVALSPITAAFEASKNLPIIGGIASLINIPLAVGGDALTNLSNEGLNALVATDKMSEETAENIRDGVNEVASLSAQIVIAGKMFKGKELETKKAELTEKFGKKDAETILKKSEQRAKLELDLPPDPPGGSAVAVKPKIDFEKFIPKEVEGVKTIEPKITPKVEGGKVSKIAKSIEAKAIEEKLTTGFKELAKFETINIKEQTKRATDLINKDIEVTRSIIRGEAPLPENLKGTSLILAMEEHIKLNPSGELSAELANSPLVKGTSLAAQEMRLAAERLPDSFTAKSFEVKKAQEAKAGKDIKKKSQLKKDIKKEQSKVNLSKEDLSWSKFLDTIAC